MALELDSDNLSCYMCGTKFPRRKGFFSVSFGELYKGIGHLPYCMNCVDKIYSGYLSKCNDQKTAVRLTCRKLDIYWNNNAYEGVAKKSSVRSIMAQYLIRINSTTYAGKGYEDTLVEEDTFWDFGLDDTPDDTDIGDKATTEDVIEEPEPIVIPEDVINFWGTGYPPEMYIQLEQRRKYYTSKFPDAFSNETGNDIGSDVLMRQLCNLEVSIQKDAAAGKSIDKSVNSLNTLIGSLNLKPAQKKDADMDADLSSTPMGVWLYRYENKRPLPEIDDQLKDVNHVKKYVFTWMGHLVKLLGLKNGYTKLYEEELERLRVEKPEYADDDEEDLLIESYTDKGDGTGGAYG